MYLWDGYRSIVAKTIITIKYQQGLEKKITLIIDLPIALAQAQ